METDPQARIDELKAKMAARKGVPGFREQNVPAIQKEIARLEAVVRGEIDTQA